MCTGNMVKTSAGNHACDTTCDGVRTVPNEHHTACGESLLTNDTQGNEENEENQNSVNPLLIVGENCWEKTSRHWLCRVSPNRFLFLVLIKCIPVGMHTNRVLTVFPGWLYPWGGGVGGVCLLRGICLLRGSAFWEGLSSKGFCMDTSLPTQTPPKTDPSVNRMTDRCKNTNFPPVGN